LGHSLLRGDYYRRNFTVTATLRKCEKDRYSISYRNRYDESGRMFPGVKEIGTKNAYVNCYDDSGKVFDGVKKIGTKPLFSHRDLFS
jgi:hypothetical protein